MEMNEDLTPYTAIGGNVQAYNEWKQRLSDDPAFLATAVQGWRLETGLTVNAAAEFIGIPSRTLEGIEQGRGFRYPLMLMNCLMFLDKETRAATARKLHMTEQN